jgi:Tfp pilus assembly protein PilF
MGANPQAAQADFEKALSLNPPADKEAAIRQNLGVLYMNQLRWSDALNTFNRVVDGLQLQSADLLVNRSMTKLNMGDRTGAQADAQKALSLDPNSARAKAQVESLR